MRTLLTVLVLVLAATNLATLAALVLSRRRTAPPPPGIASTPAPGATGRVRRLITVEILNPIELAAARGRVAGIAGSVVPEVTRRIVYDRAAKILERDLAGYDVVADVHIHTMRPPRADPAPTPVSPGTDGTDGTDEPADQSPV
jgi:hypothetical protein